jgi:hypothetical protein
MDRPAAAPVGRAAATLPAFVIRVEPVPGSCLSPLGNVPTVVHVTPPEGAPLAECAKIQAGAALTGPEAAAVCAWLDAQCTSPMPVDTTDAGTAVSDDVGHVVAFLRPVLLTTMPEFDAERAKPAWSATKLPLVRKRTWHRLGTDNAGEVLLSLAACLARCADRLRHNRRCTGYRPSWKSQLEPLTGEVLLQLGGAPFTEWGLQTLMDCSMCSPNAESDRFMRTWGEWVTSADTLFDFMYPGKNTNYVARVCGDLELLRSAVMNAVLQRMREPEPEAALHLSCMADLYLHMLEADQSIHTLSISEPSPTLCRLVLGVLMAWDGAGAPLVKATVSHLHEVMYQARRDPVCLVPMAEGLLDVHGRMADLLGGWAPGVNRVKACKIATEVQGALGSAASGIARARATDGEGKEAYIRAFVATTWRMAAAVRNFVPAEDEEAVRKACLVRQVCMSLVGLLEALGKDGTRAVMGPLDSVWEHVEGLASAGGRDLVATVGALVGAVLNVDGHAMEPGARCRGLQVLLRLADAALSRDGTLRVLSCVEPQAWMEPSPFLDRLLSLCVDDDGPEDTRPHLGTALRALKEWHEVLRGDVPPSVHAVVAWAAIHAPGVTRSYTYLSSGVVAEFRGTFVKTGGAGGCCWRC